MGVIWTPFMGTIDPSSWSSAPGPVAAVSPADLKKVWQLYTEIAKKHSGRNFAVGADIVEKVCSPGADIQAVCYRLWQLKLLQMMGKEFSRHVHDATPEERVFEVAASFPMKKMSVGVTYHEPPFDVEEFLKQIEPK